MKERFEHDSTKNRINEERHGISLFQAREIWEGSHVVIPAKSVKGGDRRAILGTISEKVYVAIFIERDDVIRLISCHRADRKWERVYEKHIQADA
jgi:uncharacterized DUF497 family protein